MANNTLPPATNPSLTFSAPPYAVRVNCFWFLSITVSLAAGITGILCKQWMREFQRDAALPPKEALALRQMRYIGWNAWGVPHLISSPAILLQASLLLFLAGMLDFLWSEGPYRPVAICATTMISAIVCLMTITTVLPSMWFVRVSRLSESLIIPLPQVPFKSPQSLLLMKTATFYSWLAHTVAGLRGIVVVML